MPDRILVVDDESLMRETLSMVLRNAGFRVTSCASSKEALLADQGHRVAIVDVFMPDMDGIELLCALRERHPLIGLVAISGGGLLPGFDVLVDCLLLGANCALEKPFTPKELMSAIEAAKNATRMPLPH